MVETTSETQKVQIESHVRTLIMTSTTDHRADIEWELYDYDMEELRRAAEEYRQRGPGSYTSHEDFMRELDMGD